MNELDILIGKPCYTICTLSHWNLTKSIWSDKPLGTIIYVKKASYYIGSNKRFKALIYTSKGKIYTLIENKWKN